MFTFGLYVLLFACNISSQNRPFPHQVNFANCLKPELPQSSINEVISTYYGIWKKDFVKSAGSTSGGYYVLTQGTAGGNAITVSEAHGYGMMIFALMATDDGGLGEKNAKAYFDGMYKFFRDHPSDCSMDLMSWTVSKNGSGGENFNATGTATDGDLDIAYALLLAHEQWGSEGSINYLNESKKVIKAIQDFEINPDHKRVMIANSSNWGNSSNYQYWLTRPSDWMTDHFKAYYHFTKDKFWSDVDDTIYSVYNQFVEVHSKKTGLITDFIDNEQPTPKDYENNGKTIYSYDACRVPWRLATDYAHFGSKEAKKILNRIMDWMIVEYSGIAKKIMAGYKLDGSATETFTSAAFTAPFMVACMVDKSSTKDLDYQKFLNSCWIQVYKRHDDYFEDSIDLLCLLLVSGNWWSPCHAAKIVYNPILSSKNNHNLTIFSSADSKSVTISYTLSENNSVKLGIYSVQGKLISRIVDDFQKKGEKVIHCNLTDKLSSNVFLVNFCVGTKSVVKRINMVK